MQADLRVLMTGLAVLVLTACGSNSDSGTSTLQASLNIPRCVSIGTRVTLDASGSKGTIGKYIFQIGPSLPALILRTSRVDFTFDKPVMSGDRYLPYRIQLTVVNAEGESATLPQGLDLYVLPTDQDCLAAGMEPGVYREDIVDVPKDTLEPDGEWTDLIFPSELVVQTDGMIQDSETPDLPYPQDLTEETIPGECPNVAGIYLVEIKRDGEKYMELEMNLSQEGCAISEAQGIVSGQAQGDGTLVFTSPYIDMHIQECTGNANTRDDGFILDCGNGWTATYSKAIID